DFELGETATAVGQLIRNEMVPDATTGLDLIAKAMVGADDRADDLLESITEYAPIFKSAGISGETAIGLMRQAIDAGSKDTDKLADAFKELSLQVTSGSTASQDAL
ncbi:phage tail tape measure protein, partial [Streptomyces sp. TRM76130]|nr:phage tail tape measure protein [Streptomyces sp. TRM76130]